MTVEQDEYDEFYVRGTSDDGQMGWGIQVWLKNSNRDGPADHRYRVIDGEFHVQRADQSLPAETTTVVYSEEDSEVETTEKRAILSLIEQWEDRLPLMVAAPI